jgi:cytochrome P450
MTETEIIHNAGTLSMAGSETSATLLGGLFFHLLTNRPILEKVTAEVLHAFKSPKEMTLAAETKLPYLQACIEEALRIYPPAPLDLLRKTPPAGAMIAGHFVPGNVRVHYSFLYHAPLKIS